MNGSFLAWQTLCLLCCLLTLFGYLVSVLSRFWHVLRGWSGENTSRAWQASMQVFLWRVARQVNDATLTRQIDNSRMKLARVCEFFPCELYSFQLWQCLNSIDNFSVSTFQGEFKFHKMKAMQDVHLCMYVCMYVQYCMHVCMYIYVSQRTHNTALHYVIEDNFVERYRTNMPPRSHKFKLLLVVVVQCK